jgi:hypothetical protein
MLHRRSSALGLLLLSAMACGRGQPAPTTTAAPPTTGATPHTVAPTPTPTEPVRTVVPNVVVRDVATGSDVNLRAFAQADRPTLYWFWAPH